jgi:hypothetical protein
MQAGIQRMDMCGCHKGEAKDSQLKYNTSMRSRNAKHTKAQQDPIGRLDQQNAASCTFLYLYVHTYLSC